MRFVYPEFLFALSALAVPLIIHLFNFRRFKRIYFSNVALLREVKEQTQSRSRLKHILVLIARMLAIAALVLAFAQPFIPGSESDELKGDKIISIYVDNSFSMEAEGLHGVLLEYAKDKAIELANEYSATDNFQLVTNDFEGHQQRLVSREEFVQMVEEIKVSPSSRKLSEVLMRQLDILNAEKGRSRRIVWFSDFQKTTSDLESMADKETPKVVCVPMNPGDISNLYIDSVWFESPIRQLRAQEKLTVRIRNTGSQRVEDANLNLEINGQPKAVSNFTVEAGAYTDSVLYFSNTSPGIQLAQVLITDPNIEFDDAYYFSFQVQEKVNVLNVVSDQVRDTTEYISRLFKNDPYFKLESKTASRLDYSRLPEYNLVILNEVPTVSPALSSELSKFVKSGGNLLVFPSLQTDIQSINNLLLAHNASLFLAKDTHAVKTMPIDARDPFFKGMFEKDPSNIDLPSVKLHFTTERRISTSKEKILATLSGGDFLSRYSSGKGFLYVCTVPLNEKAGNFARHAIFVPVVLRIAELSQISGIAEQTIGREEGIDVRGNTIAADKPFEITNEKGDYSFIPEMINTAGAVSVFVRGQVRDAGNYYLTYDSKKIQGIGFNYSRSESDLNYYTKENLSAQFDKYGLKNFTLLQEKGGELSMNVEAIDNTRSYWKECIITALLFLLIEILLIRFLKN